MVIEKGFIVAGVLVFFVLALIAAAHVLTPSSFSVDEDTNILYNLTFNNTDSGQDANVTQVNITFPSSFSFVSSTNGTTVSSSTFTSSSTVLSWTNTTTYLVNGSELQYFWFNLSAATPGDYNITLLAVNGTGSFSQNISITVNDTTVPTISYASPSESANANLSRNFTQVNVTASDVVALSMLRVFLYDSSYTLENTTNSSTSPVFMNTTGLSDGIYYFNATANDTAGNEGNVTTRTIRIDTTNPTISDFSCSASSIRSGESMTCECTGADSGSGVATTTYDATIEGGSTGSYNTTCTVTDYASNSVSDYVTYTVISSSSSTSSSSTTTWASTFILTDTQFKQGYARVLEEDERVRFTVNGSQYYVGVESLSDSQVTFSVTGYSSSQILSEGDESKFDVNADSFYDVVLMINELSSSEVNVTVRYLFEALTDEEIAAAVAEDVEVDVEGTEEDTAGGVIGGNEEPSREIPWGWIIVGVVVLGGAFLFAWYFRTFGLKMPLFLDKALGVFRKNDGVRANSKKK